MREIRFRAWDKTKGIMRHGNDNLMIDLSGNLIWQFGYNGGEMLPEEERKNYILMQYSGLRDINKKEIYDGDIIKHKDDMNRETISEVKFSQGRFIVGDGCDETCVWEFTNQHWNRKHNYAKIIGNIHKNPKLLTNQPKGDD